MYITILTATYNRANKLKKLYNSLLKQTNKNFEWFIVDDGSTDDSEKVINNFIKEGKIPILYEKKQNGGKHTALNVGISKIKSRLTVIVDSDDWLCDDAIDLIYKFDQKYKNSKELKLCGYSFLRKYPSGKINGKNFRTDELIGSYIDIRINQEIDGDKAEVWYTEILKKYPFPEFENEKFLGEDVVWIEMAKKYNMVHIKKVIVVSEYLDNRIN